MASRHRGAVASCCRVVDSPFYLPYTARLYRVRPKPFVLFVLFVLGVSCLLTPAAAHHSFVVEYDVNRPVKLEGVVTKVEWTNPHALLSLDVADPNGVTAAWSFELASPNVLERNGWTHRTLSVGDRVTIDGYGGFAIATRGVVSSITMSGGRALVPDPQAGVIDRVPAR
jgi:hypothetical protein